MTSGVLLKLPHRPFVFTLPKALRPFFRHDRRLFAEVSRVIYDIQRVFYREAAGRSLRSGMVITHQTFGDMLRWNLHFHAIVLEGGFDEEGTFFYIPFSGLQSMLETAREEGLEVTGPVLLDTVFLKAVNGMFDVVVVMYHDQGHIPLKLLDFMGGVNVPLGIPILRTSVDHVTVFGKAGKGTADEPGMIKAIELAVQSARNRRVS